MWAAGLFEGEGSVTKCGGRRRLQLKMTEEASVRRFHDEMGVGAVYGPYRNRTGENDSYPRRPFWLWVAELDDADTAAAMLLPHLTEWRRTAIHRLFPDVVGELASTR